MGVIKFVLRAFMVARNITVGSLTIPYEELSFSYIRASGPGGQNVNKVSTAAQLRFDAKNCLAIDRDMFNKLKQLTGSRMTTAGVIVITAQRFRSQERNREDALARLCAILLKASYKPKFRRPTKIGKAVKERRLDKKRRHSILKRTRERIRGED